MSPDARIDDLSPGKRALLEERLKGRVRRRGAKQITRQPRDGDLPLSFAQQRLWFLDQFEPGSPEYNIPQALRVRGPLDRAALERALTGLVARHESLRTSFAARDGRPVQVVAEPAPLPCELVELESGSLEEREAAAAHMVAEAARRPFDLEKGPLLRATLVRLDRDDHVLFVVMHHIVSDGWSMGVFTRELSVLYDAFSKGMESPLEEMPIQYADFAAWQRQWLDGDVLDKQLAYWRDHLAGLSPVLELPTDRPRPAVRSGRGATHSFALDGDTLAALRELSRAHEATLFMTLTAAFQVLLARYSGSDDVVVGTPIAGRTRAELEHLIGFFVNTLVLRTDLSGNPSFVELLTRVREVALGAYAHQDVPFEKLVEEIQPVRSLSHNPLFQVLFTLESVGAGGGMTLGDASVTGFPVGSPSTKFDLSLTVFEGAEAAAGLIEYDAELFDPETIARMAEHLSNLLGAIAAAPDAPLSQLDMLTEPERHHLTVELNDTAAEFPKDSCVHELFAAQVARTPDAIALTYGDDHLTYQELNVRANRLAHHLVSLGVGPDTLVGLCLFRSVELVVGLLAVLKAGGAYVPLDPDYPPERLSFMLDDCGARVLVTSSEIERGLPGRDAAVVLIDSGREAIEAHADTDPETTVSPDHLAYVIYTSGSTGTPKGVALGHRGVANLVTAQREAFGVTAGGSVLQFASISFDASVSEIAVTLATGARLCIRDQQRAISGQDLVEQLTAEHIDVVTLPPSALGTLPEQELPDLHTIVTAGEACPAELVKRWAPGRTFLNAYGPTESTVCASIHRCSDTETAPPPIGRPISNTRIYILDRYLNPVPKGVSGELYIGGVGLARGYLNRPGLTAERFVPDPFSGAEGARLYRSGDLARHLPNGDVEFLGRVDHQVKVRGFRIEPGEIEAALVRHEALDDAVVIARSDDDAADKRLVAYVVASDGEVPTTTELRAHLLETLPDYMVPSAFMALDALPLTPSGKIDRGALPAPEGRPDLGSAYVAPRTPTQEIVAGIWADVLGVERVGIDDNFFELGGHSLVATQVVARVRSALGVELPLRALFESPTVATLAAAVAASGEHEAPPITPVDRDGELPLSFAQQRLWFLDQLDPGSAEYNIPQTLRLQGELQRDALAQALGEIVARHEGLRTTFATVDGRPVQVVSSPGPFDLELVTVTHLDEGQREAEARRIATDEVRRPFDLEHGPLLRATLIAVHEDDHVLVVVMHHIVSDGWSMGVFARELSALYDSFSRGEGSPLRKPALQYADFAAWQRSWLEGDVLEGQLAYWRERLAGLPPVLELPTDHPRPAERRGRGASHSFALDPGTFAALRALSRAHNASLFMTLTAAFQLLLSRYSGQSDVAVGTPIAGRTHAELEDLIGFFVNTLVLRTDLSGDPGFTELLDRVRDAALGAYAHQDVPFEKLVDELQPVRSLSHTPLFQVMFTMEDASGGAPALGDVSVSGFPVGSDTTKYDLMLAVVEGGATPGAVIQYDADLFEPDTIARMGDHLTNLLVAIAAAPHAPLSELDMLAEPERHHLTAGLNDTAADYPKESCAHELFEAHARQAPDAVALVSEGRELTYGDVDASANRLAHHLAALGVTSETPIAICLERGPDLVVSALAILKAGGAYLPLDPGYPAERLAFMVRDSGASVVVTTSELAGRLDAGAARVVLVDADADAIAACAHTAPGIVTSPDDLAYVIYTSGSTGMPKGVAVSHRCLVNLVSWHVTSYGITAEDRGAHVAPVGFDASVWELWPYLCSGASLALPPEDVRTSPAEFVEWLGDNGVTVSFLPTALVHEVFSGGHHAALRARTILTGGDQLRIRPDDATSFELVNHYGPTEATVVATAGRVDAAGEAPPSIGRPIANAATYVLDPHGNPVPVGVPGELYVGGAGVARGYVNRPALTAERFVPDPFSSIAGARLYRTGDRARYLADGDIEFLGRVDHQVKVRGFRIEPGEIEAALAGHGAVGDAVVVARADGDATDKRLVAYFVPADGVSATTTELRAHLLESLPEHMVPSAFVALDAFPLTPNGKLDRAALPAPEGRPELESAYVAPRTPAEEILAGIWGEVLGLERVGIDDNFFELGGDSILSIQIIARAAQQGLRLTPKQLFQHQSVAALAAVAGTHAAVAAEQGTVAGEVPLTPIQRWFFEHDLPERHHFNQSRLVRADGVDPGLVHEALRALVDHHDALRLRYTQTPHGWTQTNAPAETDDFFSTADLSGLDADAQARAVLQVTAELEASLDLEHGPLVRACYLDLGPRGARLFISVHHLAVDGVSWRILLEDLESAYERLARGEAVALPPKTTSFKQWAERLVGYAGTDEATAEIDYWTSASDAAFELPRDFERGPNDWASAASVTVGLDEAETEALLREVPAAYRTQINDVLVAALADALARFTGRRRVLVSLEGHGREELFDDVDLTRTVGWFTTMFPVALEVKGSDKGALLKGVKEQLRAVPKRGVGYGVLRYLGDDDVKTRVAATAPVSFNYLGRFGQESGERTFGGAPEAAGSPIAAAGARTHVVEVNGAISAGHLQMSWTYSTNLHARATIERVAADFVAALRAVIAHCRRPGAGGVTRSDFPLAALTQQTLDELWAQGAIGPDTEDVYPLTPLQQGMVFHTLYEPESDVYFEQLVMTLDGDLDVDALRRAWHQTSARHAVLRSAVLWEGVQEPVQVVQRAAEVPFDLHDLTASGNNALDELLAADRARGFDLGTAPLQRVAVVRVGERRHAVVWSFHHVLLDGWSTAAVLGELFARFHALARGEEPAVTHARPYRDYIEWLQSQGSDAAEAYWREALAGFAAPTPLVYDRVADGDGAERHSVSLDPDVASSLWALTRRERVTLNTIVQGAWALLLSRYSGERDVVFGATVAGRPPELAGVEEMVGMFINTVPVRVDVAGDAPVAEWLARLQDRQVEQRSFEHAALTDIQAWSELPGGVALFDTIVAFENYPSAAGGGEAAETDVTVAGIGAIERTNYPLSLMGGTGQDLPLVIHYDRARFRADTIARMGEHLANLLGAIAAAPETPLSELEMLAEPERRHLTVELNDTATDFPKDSCFHELFAAQAAKAPDAIALVYGDDQLTYGELNARANRLAHHLVDLGIGPDTLVGLCLARGLDFVVGVLGILKAGGAFVPLDPDYPPERLSFMLEDCAARVVVTSSEIAAGLPAHDAAVVLVDSDEDAIAAQPGTDPGTLVCPDHLAYVIYTSGSTGTPKGVALGHRGVANLITAQREAFGVRPGESVLQFASVSFDASVSEIAVTLASGARLCIRDQQRAVSGQDLVDELAAERVNVVTLPPTALGMMPEAELPDLHTIVTAGESCPAEVVTKWAPGRRFLNAYGPTESTVCASIYTCSETETAPPPIGRPIANTKIYILDRYLNPVPKGVSGELYIGGEGLARGYLNRPDLTAERFVPDPFSGTEGARLYRSGDLARYLATGDVEFLGRVDHQVKVRGFRIEPGEIEAALVRHEALSDAVVIARSDGDTAGKRLVAYVVSANGELPTTTELRAHLLETLPDYMVPGAFMALDALPLTPSGKIDRGALPAPEGRPDLGSAYAAPRTPTQEIVAAIWADVLGVERVGIDDNFFELGGHSLVATQVVARVRAALGVELPLRALFESPTVAKLTDALAASGEHEAPPMAPVDRDGELPLSFAQQRLWFLAQLDPGSAEYNIPQALHLRGELDRAALKRALGEIVARHESLRTTFTALDGSPVQVIAPPAPPQYEIVDLTGLSPDERTLEARRVAGREAHHSFDLERGPLLRATLISLDEDDHVLLLVMHHIVSDGWSMGVLTRELSAVYEAFRRGEESPLAELPLQYADYAAWQRRWLEGDVLEAQLAYWKAQLAGLAPVLELPTDHPRPAVRRGHGATHFFALDPDTLAVLRSLSLSQNATMFMTVLAAFQLLLARYSGQRDVAVGTPIAGRTHSELEDLIGFFVNTLVLRTDLSGDPSFTELVARVRDVALGAYAHQDLPFEKLVEELQPVRSLSHTPLFQVMFGFDSVAGGEQALGDASMTGVGVASDSTKFDLTLSVAEDGDSVAAVIEYDADLFEPATIARMGTHFANLLDAIAAAPDAPLSELDMLAEAERHHVTVELNDTAAGHHQGSCVHELFQAHAQETPRAIALAFGDVELTYGELNASANRLAHHLVSLGVGPDTLVGVYLERSVDLVVSLLAVLKAGAAYVPLDPDYPEERVAFMLADAGVPVVVTAAELAGRLGASVEAVLLDADRDAIAARPAGDPVTAVTGDDVAYVIYTSGSAGTPKGVAVSHEALAGHCASLAGYYAMTPADRMLVFASFSFDATVEHTFAPLAAGASIVVRDGDVWDPETLAGKVERYGITLFDLPTAYWHQVAADASVARRLSSSPTLRIAAAGGEAMTTARARAWMEASDGRLELLNTYGPTEATVTTTSYPLAGADALRGDVVPIGRPFTNNTVYILDAHGNPAPLGVPGELYVGGGGVARGYVNRPALTAEKFVPDPFSPVPGARLYRTGDRARYLGDGNVEFLGRVDHQVKIRGFRIEPGEIEARLADHEALADAVVLAREDAPGDRRLVAYVVAHEEAPTTTELRSHLLETLPGYMVPSAFVALDALPLTPNGKLDRAALPAPEGRPELEGAYVAPRSPAEEILAGIWSDVLGLERVGVDDNFFELGGHSLIATQVVARVRAALGVELPLRRLFEAPTVAALAGVVAASGDRPQAPPIAPVDRDGELPLSFAQQRLWFLDQLEPGGAEYNIPQALRLRGELDRGALERAFGELAARHETLRTTFATVDGRPVQVVAPPAPVAVELIALEDLEDDEREDSARRVALELARRPFDLERGPLLRTALVRVAEHDHVLVVVMHHIVSDAWSSDVFTRELAVLYDAFSRGEPSPLDDLPVQYADFAAWQREWLAGETLEEQLAYWRGQLAGLAPVLELPTDNPRPAVRTTRGATHAFAVDAATLEALRALSRAHNATLFMTGLAAFQLLLSRWSGQTDVAVGTPTAGRTHAELEGLIGFFVNTLVLRTDLSGNPSFEELLARVRDAALGAYAHQDVPFEKLVEELRPVRSLSHSPLFQVMFTTDQRSGGGEPALGDASVTGFPLGQGTAKFDLTLSLVEEGPGGVGVIGYNSDLFRPETIARLGDHLANLLRAIATAPEKPLSELDMLAEPERRHLTVELNDTAAPYPTDACLHELFAAQARKTPGALALVHGDDELTFQELDASANRLAHHLVSLGAGPGTLVGICLHRGLDMVVAVLATLKAGGAYVPLDASYPKDRLAFMLRDTEASVLVTSSDLLETLPGSDAATVLVDKDQDTIAGHPATAPEPTARPDDLAYVIYTSGSTGTPKGVAVTHASVVNLAEGLWDKVFSRATELKLATVNASLSFDSSVKQLTLLLRGVALDVVPDEAKRDPAAFVERYAKRGYDAIDCTPTQLKEWVDAGLLHQGASPHPTLLLLGGEKIPQATWETLSKGEWLAFNVYGPTETTVDATAGGPELQTPSIGRPLPNVQIYILDAHANPVPLGVAGELYIGGAGVARGYLNRPGLTAERFVPDPFSNKEGARLYRTGDLARYLPDGNVEFLGRVDHQVKVRGFRIEPGEIEAALIRHDAVTDAAVIARADGDRTDKRLVAYVVADRDAPTTTDLRAHLSETLPEHMVPSAFVTLDELPLTPNGKLDRAALPAPEGRPELEAAYAAPRTPVEDTLAAIWRAVLGVERVGVHDDFFEAGGHSLLAAQVVALANRHGLELVARDVFEHPRLADLGRVAETGKAGEYEWTSPVVLNGAGTGEPVFLVNPATVTTPYVYRGLNRGVAPGHPAFALQPVPAEGRAGYLVSVAEMAGKCAGDLTKLWPEGRYVLGGWSMGGLIAWETAVQLESAGRPPGALLLIDPSDPTPERDRDEANEQKLDRWFRDLLCLLEGATGPTLDDGEKRALSSMYEEAGMPLQYVDYPVSDLIRLTKGGHIGLYCDDYDPPAYGGDVILVVTDDATTDDSARLTVRRERSVEEKVAFWRDRVHGEFQAYVLDGTHQSIVVDPAREEAVAQLVNGSFEPADPDPGPSSALLTPVDLGDGNG
jgi:amino acid adenylation domain-containing protein/non-ribosomal peptide synthase protein (TIGR01720 family)